MYDRAILREQEGIEKTSNHNKIELFQLEQKCKCSKRFCTYITQGPTTIPTCVAWIYVIIGLVGAAVDVPGIAVGNSEASLSGILAGGVPVGLEVVRSEERRVGKEC